VQTPITPRNEGSSNNKRREHSLLSKIIVIVKLLYSPIFELIEVKRALKYVITRLLSKLVAMTLLNYKCIKIRKEMNKVSTYHDFENLGLILDKLQGKDVWKREKESHLYDYQRIESRLENM